MEYRQLGGTGRSVSRIGFGGATAGISNYVHDFDPRDAKDRQGVIDGIREALALGINYFDTAESYGAGASEEIFGEGLEGVPSGDIFIASKVTPTRSQGGVVTARGGDDARRSLEASLKRLRRDYIDLIQIHGSYYAEETAIALMEKGGLADALQKAREEGLVRHIGFSIECQNAALDRFVESGRFDTMQVQYNLIFQHPYDPSFTSGSLYKAKEHGLGVIIMRTVTSGIFQSWIQLVNPENTFNYSPALLQFVLSNPLVDVALLGMRSAARVRENVAIHDDLSGRIDIAALHNRFPTPSK
jgi:aryl-alcohol dehydrogenase-like predicted oxidoreductase